MYQSYTFTEPLQTTMPVQVEGDEVWVTSVPPGADIYIQLYNPDETPSHATAPEAYRGKTPLLLALPPGSYWLELALEAVVFEAYFSPPYDNAQFERDGAVSEALLFRPFSPGEKRRVLRYYRLEKQAQQGQTLIGLFQPRGEVIERAAALYPPNGQYNIDANELQDLLRQAQVPDEVTETLSGLLQRGGKVFWSAGSDYSLALEVRPNGIQGNVSTRYMGTPLPTPLLPDGGAF